MKRPRCAQLCSQGSLCNTLKIAQPDDRSAPRRYGNILSSMSKQIPCASCRSAAPCLDKSGCPRTFSTSSVSNSGLTTFAHVRKFDSRNVWFAGFQPTPFSRAPPKGLQAQLWVSSFFRQRWNCGSVWVSALNVGPSGFIRQSWPWRWEL